MGFLTPFNAHHLKDAEEEKTTQVALWGRKGSSRNRKVEAEAGRSPSIPGDVHGDGYRLGCSHWKEQAGTSSHPGTFTHVGEPSSPPSLQPSPHSLTGLFSVDRYVPGRHVHAASCCISEQSQMPQGWIWPLTTLLQAELSTRAPCAASLHSRLGLFDAFFSFAHELLHISLKAKSPFAANRPSNVLVVPSSGTTLLF